MRVKVYRNLQKKCWSVQYKGKVIAHLKSINLKNAVMKVSKAGRDRVLREKKKYVHAYIEGEWVKYGKNKCLTQVSYNPYYKGYFFKVRYKARVHHANNVYLDRHSKVWISQ